MIMVDCPVCGCFLIECPCCSEYYCPDCEETLTDILQDMEREESLYD